MSLVKQVLQHFHALSCFILHLASIKLIGVALLTQQIMNSCKEDYDDAVLTTEGPSEIRNTTIIKVCG